MDSKVWIGIVAMLLLAATAQAVSANASGDHLWLKCETVVLFVGTTDASLRAISIRVFLSKAVYIACIPLKNTEETANNTERVFQTLMRVRNPLVSVNVSSRATWNIE